MIVCSHDPREPNLSTHTSSNECLLIARRNGEVSKSTTMFVNLRRFPRMAEAVQDVVAALRNGRIDEVGSVCEWSEERVRAGDWSPVQWFDPELAQAARTVRKSPGLIPLRDLFEIGPPGRSIHDEFERVPDGSTEPDQVAVFDSVSSRLRVSLAGEPDAYWRPRSPARRRRRAKPGLVESHLLGEVGCSSRSERIHTMRGSSERVDRSSASAVDSFQCLPRHVNRRKRPVWCGTVRPTSCSS